MSFHKSSAFCLAFQKMIYSFVQISHIAMRFFFSLNILFSVYVTKLFFFSNLMMLSILRVWVEFYLQNAENKSVYNKGYFCLLKKQIAHNTMYVHWKNNPRTFFDPSYKFPYSFLQTPRPWTPRPSLAIRLNDSRLVEGVMRTIVYSAFLYHVKNLDHQR